MWLQKCETSGVFDEVVFFFGGWGGFLVGGFKHFLFSPRTLGKISILTNIFQMD